MPDRRQLLTSATALAAMTALGVTKARANINITLISHYQVMRFIDADSVELLNGKVRQVVRRGETFLGCTLMEIVDGDFVVVEDLTAIDGDMLIVDLTGVRWRLGKTAESAAGAADLHGHTADEIGAGSRDVLAQDFLGQPGDPAYDGVAAVLPPISQTADGVWNFIGAPGGSTVPFAADGTCAGFDAAGLQPSIADVRAAGRVMTGLLGGYLPCLRFVYPEGEGAWTETLAYVPFDGGASRVRVTRIESGRLVWTRGMVMGSDAAAAGDGGFHAGLAALKTACDGFLSPGMKIDAPDMRMADMARHGLVRARISGADDTSVSAAMAAWGLATDSDEVGLVDDLTLLGLPLDASGNIAGAVAAGQGLGALAGDHVRQALLTTCGVMAHLHTRGGWMAVASRPPFSGGAGVYSPATQAALPLLLRGLLAFESVSPDILNLGRGLPQSWLADGKLVFIDDIATRWGRVSFATDSRIDKEHRIAAKVVFPDAGIAAVTKFRFRAGRPIRSVRVSDKSWKDVDVASGDVNLPAGMGGTVILEIRY